MDLIPDLLRKSLSQSRVSVCLIEHSVVNCHNWAPSANASRLFMIPCWAAPRGCDTPGPAVCCVSSSLYQLNQKQLCFIQRPHGQLHTLDQICPAPAILIPAGTLGLKSGWFSRCSSFVKWFLFVYLSMRVLWCNVSWMFFVVCVDWLISTV